MSHATSELRLYGLDPKQLALYFLHFLCETGILSDLEAKADHEKLSERKLSKTEISFNFDEKKMEVTIWSGGKNTYPFSLMDDTMIKFFRMGKNYHDKEVREALSLVEVNAIMGMLNMSAVTLIASK